MYKGFLLLACSAGCTLAAAGQDSVMVSVTGYGEVYYVYDNSKPPTHTRPPFVYSHNRTGEVAINLAFLKASFATARTRANLAVMAGTYSNANLAAEPGVLKNLFEANAGVRISKQHALWVDAGVLPSHIGSESAIGKENGTLTRSLAADNSPYYETGVRLSYSSANKKWYTAVLLLNGWQRIQRVAGNHTPAFGTQVTFKPSDRVSINASTYVGSDQPDTARRMRYFHNLYSVIALNERLQLTLGLDAGREQKQPGSASLYPWYSPVILLRIKTTEALFVGVRGEQYSDRWGVILPKHNGQGYTISGCSSNVDWKLDQRVWWRLEGRWMKADAAVFQRQDGNSDRENWSASTALCFSF